MQKNIVMPYEFATRVMQLCGKIFEHKEIAVDYPDVEFLADEVFKLLGDKVDRMKYRREFLETGGSYKK